MYLVFVCGRHWGGADIARQGNAPRLYPTLGYRSRGAYIGRHTNEARWMAARYAAKRGNAHPNLQMALIARQRCGPCCLRNNRLLGLLFSFTSSQHLALDATPKPVEATCRQLHYATPYSRLLQRLQEAHIFQDFARSTWDIVLHIICG